MKNIVVLISGHGSNLQALIDACKNGRLKGKIVAVFSNNAEAYGLERAQNANIPTCVLNPEDFADRAAFDAALANEIEQYEPALVILAGYMRILSPEFVAQFAGKMLNIHPSLLPKYPGLHTHRKALENGDREHGTSVHFVTDELDGGPLILQAKVPVFSDDTEESLSERVKTHEHTIYPMVINWFLNGRLVMRDNEAWLDSVRIPPQGYAAE
ncbi:MULTISPECIES: phosphoribosylglycinamide formyltransferase [Pectobacterium]|jgi:phosphoribosylglycinamide formyltransferase-1|uniref:Phosphoribosylglycinamide formyltransferase n=1 Tax=Pectobacterium versatile TaxID=2488639 RepID=A0A221TC26_9GAMM|nr:MULTISPECIES: phosphoribosylglycinamide formyltransferase [Pectobacterium]ASN86529.1 Phosphoribosylglycinamide formyltransferase [Pectobacterium versatile]AVT57922.1 phosphoribosylglycinamide formyltransferase [Pectobacterium versatile]AZK62012.1 phosphoribosylglycinamide formyltransferase [Pectobacterium versatile]KHS84934.1 phosphoribosylglycinamide formyltransferase [Pectobacterium carotovorum subsp. carotovorum]MBA0161664.1 phosphoribosylglycinamide formyltransferase [Pectobacterium ver